MTALEEVALNVEPSTDSGRASPASSDVDAPAATTHLPGSSARLPDLAHRLRRTLVANSAIVIVVVAWQAWVWFGSVSSVVMPSPLEVVSDLLRNRAEYVPDVMSTVRSTMIGLVLGCLLGVSLAMVVHLWSMLRTLVQPTVLIVRSVPMVAMIPVFARIFGYNVATVVVVSTLVAYFPAFVLAVRGLDSATASQRDLMAALGASKAARFRLLDMPCAVPELSTALRLAAVASVVGTLIAEFVIGAEGLGQLFISARVTYEMARSWGVAVLGTLLSLALFGAATWVGNRAQERWT